MIKIIKVSNDIVLRQIQLSDASTIFNLIDSQREYLGEWLPFVAFTQKESDTLGFIKATVEARPENREYVFVIVYQGEFAGLVGFKETDHVNRKTEIGYWLSEPMQGKGIIRQSVKKMCQFAYEELLMNRIQIKCAVGNVASEKIPVNLNFHFEGIERAGEKFANGQFVDLKVYSLLKEEFK